MTEAVVQTEDLQLEGFHCADCADTIEKTVVKLGGVQKVQANFTSGRVKIEYDPLRVARCDLVRSVEKIGYRVSGDVHRNLQKKRFWKDREFQFTLISGLLLAFGIAGRFLMDDILLLTFLKRDITVSVILLLLAVIFGAYHFAREGWASLKNLKFNMNGLMSLAVVGAIIIGEYIEAASLAFLFSAAELLESYAVERARNSLRELMNLAPDRASVKNAEGEIQVPVDRVEIGDILLIRPGEKVPLDGEVVEGASTVDQAPITGESVPVSKNPGEKVFAGSVNVEGYLEVRTSERYDNTVLSRIIHMVEEAESQKAPSQRFVEKFARIYTPSVVAVALLVAIFPPLLLGASFNVWFIKALTLLVIACPCAMVISTPVSVVSALTNASRNGVLIKGGIHLEEMGKVKAIAFDKTGTLTKGKLAVTDIIPLNGLARDELLKVAASVERRSEHPVARAIAASAADLPLRPTVDFNSIPGKGVSATLDKQTYYLGKADLFDPNGTVLPDKELQTLQSEGKTTMIIGTKSEVIGIIGLQDEIRPGAADMVARLQAVGKEIVMITGDHLETARSIAKQLGIDQFHAGLLPDQKVEQIQRLTEKYGKVAMVGDGINDAPALATASVGIAMAVAGTDTALETADIALMSDDLSKLPYLVKLSKQADRVIQQNIIASIALKFGLAIGVFPGLVSLVIAVLVGDMGASLAVTSNALRLARIK
jgi:Cd2+/Zn2+-exporting ATPase